MLHKCANPLCSRLFRKMNEGRLFQLSSHSARAWRQGAHALEYFWLCDQCALFLTVAISDDSVVSVIPRTREAIPPPTMNSNLGEIPWNA
jgi:hypothetical protein